MKRTLASKHAKFYTINATDIARNLGFGSRTNTILQAAFFTLSGVIPLDQAVSEMKDAIYKTYYKTKGQAVVDLTSPLLNTAFMKSQQFLSRQLLSAKTYCRLMTAARLLSARSWM